MLKDVSRSYESASAGTICKSLSRSGREPQSGRSFSFFRSLSVSLSLHIFSPSRYHAIDRARKRINRESMTSWNTVRLPCCCARFSFPFRPPSPPPSLPPLPWLRFVNQGRIAWRCDAVCIFTSRGEPSGRVSSQRTARKITRLNSDRLIFANVNNVIFSFSSEQLLFKEATSSRFPFLVCYSLRFVPIIATLKLVKWDI